MWKELGHTLPDPDKWFRGWYDVVGLYLAMGKTFSEIYNMVKSDEMKEIVTYLDTHYKSSAWYEHK
jgi:hypothetical protein